MLAQIARNLRPDLTAALFFALVQADAAESFCQACAEVKGQLGNAELILCPTWGGFQEGCQHWTLLTLVKDGTKTWRAKYRDSLSSGPDQDCRDAAEKILTLLATALNQDVAFPPEIYNKAFQPKASNTCGFYVIHWMDQDARSHLGEGISSAGYPEVPKWRDREGVRTGATDCEEQRYCSPSDRQS